MTGLIDDFVDGLSGAIDKATHTDHRKDSWQVLLDFAFKRANGKCKSVDTNYVGTRTPMKKTLVLHGDHKNPKANNGSNSKRNIQAVCSHCNAEKSDKIDGRKRRRDSGGLL